MSYILNLSKYYLITYLIELTNFATCFEAKLVLASKIRSHALKQLQLYDVKRGAILLVGTVLLFGHLYNNIININQIQLRKIYCLCKIYMHIIIWFGNLHFRLCGELPVRYGSY